MAKVRVTKALGVGLGLRMKWEKLVDIQEENLWRGTVFRFPAVYPFESVVDFLLFFDPHSESGFSLICSTGYKCGHHEGSLPVEARASGNVKAISRSWLIENWKKWVYPDTALSEILVSSGYPQEIGENA